MLDELIDILDYIQIRESKKAQFNIQRRTLEERLVTVQQDLGDMKRKEDELMLDSSLCINEVDRRLQFLDESHSLDRSSFDLLSRKANKKLRKSLASGK